MSNSDNLLVAAWYNSSLWLYLLWPVSLLYRLIVGIRHLFYRNGWLSEEAMPVPVIVVGNITVGGTGKTPTVIALVDYLKKQGFKPGIVSRGYGGSAPEYPYEVTVQSSVNESGDEPLLMATRTAVPVVVDANRPAAARKLIETYSCDVIVSDDGMQHYALWRDIEIAIVDGARRLGNGHCLPMGPLREPADRLGTVDFIIVNGDSQKLETDTEQYTMLLQAGSLTSLDGSRQIGFADWGKSSLVHAVAGIGNPDRFFQTLRQLGFTLIEHAFADHHQFVASDLDFGDDLPIIMTEKDAVKVQQLDHPVTGWYLPVDAVIEDRFYESVVQLLRD